MSKALKEGLEGEEQRLHRIRITLTSKDLKSIERGNRRVERVSDTTDDEVSSTTKCGYPVCMFELRIYKRLIDLHSASDVVRQITSINIDPGVEVEVTVSNI
ncbi:40s ribosomal protein S20, putative [Eimeria acervulina]|uniref:40s ribosomal protein S20, putative n=1 Tax=Eimeria acervulina TaxID=5801 RepID=U6GGD5_EIMAC|nr:40s ribosomal protein S20, putative [Eimeria acervulina]CDI78358.1 40s ribosomal protein S20, putative [Eimeria acervulina]